MFSIIIEFMVGLDAVLTHEFAELQFKSKNCFCFIQDLKIDLDVDLVRHGKLPVITLMVEVLSV